MGNHRFKLSNMMPNAWFYKLRDMNKPRNQNTSNSTKKRFPLPTQNPRKSFYHSSESENFYTSPKNMKAFDTQFPRDPPRRSSKTKTRRKTIYKPSPTKTNPSVCACNEPEYPVWLKPVGTMQAHYVCRSPLDFPTSPDDEFHDSLSSEYEYLDSPDEHHEGRNDSWSRSSSIKLTSDIIVDMKNMSCDTQIANKLTEFELISEIGLRPILTKPSQHNATSKSSMFIEKKIQPKQKTKTSSSPASRKSFSRNPGVKIRNKLTSKRNESRGRKSMKGEKKSMFYSESFAVVKSSFDPEHDFRESMMEMIVENNIRASKDLEELLACYLSLNSNQYHHLIIKAFEQIWFTMPQN